MSKKSCLIYSPNKEANFKILLFHHAGGSHYLYRGWEELFPKNWEVCKVELPGRGRLAHEPLFDNLTNLLDYLLQEIILYLDIPFGFFGHSLGALIAYELTCCLQNLNLPCPQWLGLSSRGAPTFKHPHDISNKYLLPDEELIFEIWKMGGTPRVILENPDLWPIISRVVRADLKIAESSYDHQKKFKVSNPISIFSSENDHTVTLNSMLAWNALTSKKFSQHVYPGDHFYLNSLKNNVINDIINDINFCCLSYA